MPRKLSVCIVGAGPRGTSLLERLCALAPGRLGGRHLDIHVVDPFPPGPGRVWRRDQSSLLWMNSPIRSVRMFADPIPSLADWIRGTGGELLLGGPLAAEARRLHDRAFASRPLAGEYFSWVHRTVVESAPESITVVVHDTSAIDITDHGDHQSVRLAGSDESIAVDVTILAQGHLDTQVTEREDSTRRFADLHGLTYIPCGYFSEQTLAPIGSGEPVIMRGLGLGFIDCMALLTEGRGGDFRRDGNGGLSYFPSGREPRLYVGSRRGVPYHPKFDYDPQGADIPLPRFFTSAMVRELWSTRGPLDFMRDLWPLVAKEMTGAYYQELFTAHPERTTVCWQDFLDRYSDVDWDSAAAQELIVASVPDSRDRLDLAWTDRPMAGRRFGDAERLQTVVRDYIANDLMRRRKSRYSAEVGTAMGVNSAVVVVLEAMLDGLLSTKSQTEDVEGWFLPLSSYLTSGPPGRRLDELLALSRAGVVTFIGPDMQVTEDAEAGVFLAHSAAVPTVVSARCLVEARLPQSTIVNSKDALLQRMAARGACAELEPTGKLAVRLRDHRVLTASGEPHPRRFAIGPWVTGVNEPGGSPYEFGFLEQSDALARTVLDVLTGQAVPL